MFQSILVDCQRGLGGTLRVKLLTWGHGPNSGLPKIWLWQITCLIIFVISSLSSLPFLSLFTSTPTPTYSTSLAFIDWSKCMGMATIGTPNFMLSIIELHLQWLIKPPILAFPRTLLFGAHPSMTIILSPTLLRNPMGSASSTLVMFPLGNLTTHMKLILLNSNPWVISSISSLARKYSLPKATNKIEC